MPLHFVDDFGGPFYVFLLTADYQIRPSGGDLDAETFSQKPKVTVGWAKQLKLPIGRI
jgi:hypothetical protein